MRIHIKSSDGKVKNIPVPFWLALKFLANIGGKAADNVEDGIALSHGDSESAKEEIKKLSKGLKAAKKQWGHLKIVEVFSADGEEVTITL